MDGDTDNRKAFESWLRIIFRDADMEFYLDGHGEYVDARLNTLWACWKASRHSALMQVRNGELDAEEWSK